MHACPLQDKCMSKDIVYKATVNTGNTQNTKHYIGMTSNTFKENQESYQISSKQSKQRKECMLFNHPRAHVSYLSIKEARTFSKFVYHLKIPPGKTDCSGNRL